MPLTHAEILARIQTDAWVTVNTDWDATLIATYMASVLKEISQRVPFPTNETHPTDRWAPTRGVYLTDGSTREIRVTDWDWLDLVKLSQEDGVEYPVDESPKQFKNFVLGHKVLRLELDDIPAADESVYIYPQRQHILQSAIGTSDLTGAINTTAAIGATSLVLKGFTGTTINKYTKLTIAHTPVDSTEYMVTATVTIGTTETVVITPALVAVATADDVVTLALAESTLTPPLEEIMIKWVTGKLIQGYTPKLLSSTSAGLSATTYFNMGKDMVNEAKQELSGLEIADCYKVHPRS